MTTSKTAPIAGNGSFTRDMVTSAKPGIRRLQVDIGNTGFFDNREFRYFRELAIPANASFYTRVTVIDDGIILRLQSLAVDAGAVRFRAWRDLTVDATFTEANVFANNNLPSAPEYTRKTLIEESGAPNQAPTGGIVAEVQRLRSAGATAQQASVGINFQGERGIGPGVYHLQFENLTNAQATAVYDLIFEERIGQG